MTASAMSASIAHELNQPLSAILNNAETAEILLNGISFDQDDLKEIIADIRRDDQRAVDIIKHLRMLLKHDDIALQETNLSKLLSDTLRLVRLHAKNKGVALQVDPLPANILVRADGVHIQQVILNLTLNAIDAMQDIPADDRILRLRVSQKDDRVMVSIADTGTGIPQDKLKGIFEPFVTTKAQGTGLGLSIARTIIRTYGGEIWAENGAEGGAIFHFTLITAQAQAV
jgi:C4-dicarboxylate-specific signal transduction histidine kinase